MLTIFVVDIFKYSFLTIKTFVIGKPWWLWALVVLAIGLELKLYTMIPPKKRRSVRYREERSRAQNQSKSSVKT